MNRFDPKQLEEFAVKLGTLINSLPTGKDKGYAIGLLVRQELDRTYRRGYTDGLRDGKGQHEGQHEE